MGITKAAGGGQTLEGTPVRLARLGVECPVCHFQQFVEVALDQWPLDLPAAKQIHAQLASWMMSHCPDHLAWIASKSKN